MGDEIDEADRAFKAGDLSAGARAHYIVSRAGNNSHAWRIGDELPVRESRVAVRWLNLVS